MDRRAFVSLIASSGAAAWLAPARALAGPCALPGFAPSFVTLSDVEIGRGGGVLVGLSMVPGAGGRDGGDDALARGGYRLVKGRTSIPLREERVAPGLLRLVPTRHVPGEYLVRGPAGTMTVRLVARDARTPPVCVATRALLTRNPGSQMPYSPATFSVLVAFAAPLGAGAEGVLLTSRAPRTEHGVFAHAGAGVTSVMLYQSPGRCMRDVPGISGPGIGHAFRLSVVGADGVVGEPSNEVTVVESEAPQGAVPPTR